MRLENDALRAEVSLLGAELTEIYDKRHRCEVLWEGDPTFWKRHSPVLFPNVGKTWQNRMTIGGKSYPTAQHGFARDRMFTCIKEADDRLVFLLKSDAETLERYPYAFELEIEYRLMGSALEVLWRVRNPSTDAMYFTIGGHPAFRFSRFGERKQDYQLYFPGKQSLEYVLIDPATGCCNAEHLYSLPLKNGRLALNEALFANDALILDGGQVAEVWLCGADGTPCVGMRCPDFPNFGIWSVKDAPFVCLEPWMGRCDDNGFDREFSEKNNINQLAGGAVFEKRYDILLPD